MDLQSYITSGILELYVSGLATPEEAREVEQMAEQHPEVQAELDSIQKALEAYAGTHAVRPPAGLKEKVMQRLEAAPKSRPKETASQKEPTSTSQYSYEPRESSGSGSTNIASIASWILGLALLGSLVAIFLFWQDAERAKAKVQAAKDETEQLRKDCEAEKAKAKAVNDQFVVLRHWATKPVQLKATPIGGDAYAIVFWNKVKKTTYLDLGKLPKPAADKQFQLWAIVDGKPTDMGVFEVADTNDLVAIESKFIEAPQAFAITLEPKGGSAVPTLDQMWVVGAVGKG
ncbi:MAG: anti-sigma factor [Saprospiraceae bacterium]|nr:anti-sigma factor [Saprospiraceae bacterium]